MSECHTLSHRQKSQLGNKPILTCVITVIVNGTRSTCRVLVTNPVACAQQFTCRPVQTHGQNARCCSYCSLSIDMLWDIYSVSRICKTFILKIVYCFFWWLWLIAHENPKSSKSLFHRNSLINLYPQYKAGAPLSELLYQCHVRFAMGYFAGHSTTITTWSARASKHLHKAWMERWKHVLTSLADSWHL